MRKIFAAILVGLLTVSGITALTMPDAASPVPVLYWNTDTNPARYEQVALFHQWLIDRGHVTKDGRAVCELRIDTANRGVSKQIIQGVSGVAADIMDVQSAPAMQQLQAIGLLCDLTDDARQFGFDPSQTYPSVESEITIDGRQFMFPCNVAVWEYWVNLDAFARVGQEPPPSRWTFDEFEARGKAYVAAANKGLDTPRYFFAGTVERQTMMRSIGLDMFNETLTASRLDDPRYARTLQRIYQWTYVDHLLPSAADFASFATESSGFGGSQGELFASGNIALMLSGRFVLIRFREISDARVANGEAPLHLDVVEPMHDGFPNARLTTRAAAIYAGSRHPELAKLFLAYLASEPYNLQIARDADALPPNPASTRTDAFLRPPERPEEWGVHEKFSDATETIAIGSSDSPFVLSIIAARIESDAFDAFINNLTTAEGAGLEAAIGINEEIQRALTADKRLQPEYERRVALQKKIDACLRDGRLVPIEWISNPFYRRYYAAMGMTTSSSTPVPSQDVR